MTQRSYTRTEPQPFLRCSGCGSAVDDIVAHEAWHTFTETQLQAMRDLLLELREEVMA